jgi:hypothetical protein
MNTSSLFASTMLAVMVTLGSANAADHRLYRELDDSNNHAMTHARDARWEVHDHFGTSRDYEALREDSWALVKALRNVEDAIFRERTPHAILDLVNAAHDVVNHFEEHVENSDFNRISYRGRARIRPAGYTHVVELQSILRTLHEDMDQMIAVLEREVGHHHHRGGGIEVVPDRPYRLEPGVPSPGPALPGVLIPDLSASSEVVVPLIRTRMGSGSVTIRH